MTDRLTTDIVEDLRRNAERVPAALGTLLREAADKLAASLRNECTALCRDIEADRDRYAAILTDAREEIAVIYLDGVHVPVSNAPQALQMAAKAPGAQVGRRITTRWKPLDLTPAVQRTVTNRYPCTRCGQPAPTGAAHCTTCTPKT